MPREHRIAEIRLDDLRVDPLNIRQGIWINDPELVASVKAQGVLETLVVRPDKEGITKYTIVCGSRRYNAALEAGLETVPCNIRNLSDKQTAILSYIENMMREDIPKWQNIDWIGKQVEKYGVEEVASETGHSIITIATWWGIYKLPDTVKGLLRPPDQRTRNQKNAILMFNPYNLRDTLNIGAATTLFTELGYCDQNTIMETAVFIMKRRLTNQTVTQFLPLVKIYHQEDSIEEIWMKYKELDDSIHQVTLYFLDETWDAIRNACLEKQRPIRELLTSIIENWLYEIVNESIKNT